MNILKISTAISAVIFMASCNEKLLTENNEEAGYITVTSQIGSQTKAGYETKLLPTEFIMDIVQGTDEAYNYSVVMQNNGIGNSYTESTGKYLAWASTDHSKVTVKAMTIPSGASLDGDKTLNISIEKDQTTNENFIKNDILGATNNTGITITGNSINVTFSHLMSKLHVVYESTDNSIVEAITLRNVAVEGAWSYANMDYVKNDNSKKDDIEMFRNAGTQYGVFAAEAIFCPYTPSSSSMPTLDVKVSGVEKPISCEIVLPSNFSFESGKRYVMKIQVSANSASQKSLKEENDWVKNVPGGKILWVGTSIPAGGGTIYSYPQMIANATGLEVINNAVGGSVLMKDPNRESSIKNDTTKESWDASTHYLQFGGLVQSYDYIESYYGNLLKLKNDDVNWINKHLDNLKALSYQSLIIPYIDGTLDNCQTIVIDHGFNELGRILPEAGAFIGWDTDPNSQYADVYFDGLINEKSLINIGVPDYNQYKEHLRSRFWDIENPVLNEDYSYLIAMESIINACRIINPEINIIIGNYFTIDNLWIHYWYGLSDNLTRRYARTLCNYNKAAAKLFNCRGIVNVCDFLDISDSELWSGQFEYKPDGSVGAVVANDKFCPDGVHPSSDYTGGSNKAIADIYLQELAKIFATTTKSAGTQMSTAADYGWEDIELL